MNFRKVNNLTGWAVFFIAFLTYFLTREARGSLWDCGEFVSCAYKVQLPHPPGAPMFVLLGRFFTILFGDKGSTAANAVNSMSALASGATILFLFWTITHFARKMFVKAGEALSAPQTFTVMAAGVLGALVYTYSDSFWFSAGEGEVYALSSFFTALVFWAMLKWEHSDEHAANDPVARARSDRWIVFLFFMMGLSIGVHLLNLLTIPAVVMIYYYRRYNASTKGSIIAFIVGCLITGLVQLGVIVYSMKSAGLFDIFFVNKGGLPFFSGFSLYFLGLTATIVWALRFKDKDITRKKMITWFVLFLALFTLPFYMTTISVIGGVFKFLFIALLGVLAGYYFKPSGLKVLKLSLWSFSFMMLGYLLYLTAIIRSNANPAIDMNDVDNPINLVYYLSREQYGSAPTIYGPHFLADVKRYEEGPRAGYPILDSTEMKYVKGKKKYIEIGREKSYQYKSEDKQLFPRVWDPSNDQFHFDTYIDWLNIPTIQAQDLCQVTGVGDGVVQTQDQAGKSQTYSIEDNYSVRVRQGQVLQRGERIAVKKPTYGDNFRWFFTYQLGFMYWRYFMWNFAGKQNDVQGSGNIRDGNWITGIPFMDNKRLGDQDKIPDSINQNKAHNKLYLLPFLLGILGCVYQFIRNRKDWIVNFLLFFFTGIAVVLYLNQPGSQPRERDYAYVGSFYAFAIWIGLAIPSFIRLIREKADKLTFQNTLLFGSILTFLIMMMSTANETFSGMIMTAFYSTALYIAFVALLTYLFRSLSKNGTNLRVLNIGITVVCLIAPLIMANQEWDDHDRSHKTTAPDIAKDYLESCAPNAILFTFGDNDTYPLWYAQEVEGVRPDIRIINNSLLGIDWYINQLRYKINEADSVDVIWTPEQIEGHNREYLYYDPNTQISQEAYYPLLDVMKNVLGKPAINPETHRDTGPDTYPVKRFSVSVDTGFVRKNGTVGAKDSILSEIKFELQKNALQRNDLMILNIIAANGWKRPIYFTGPVDLGFSEYLRKDGLSYRLVPVANSNPQGNWITNTTQREVGLGSTPIRSNNSDAMFQNLMNKYEFGGANKKGVYFDEENRRHILALRELYAEAAGNLADQGRKDEAKKILEKCEAGILPANLPYAAASRYNGHNQTTLVYLEACYKAGMTDLAEKIRKSLHRDLDQQKAYYLNIRDNKPDSYGGFERSEAPINDAVGMVLDAIEKKYLPQPPANPAKPAIDSTGPRISPVIDTSKKTDTGKQH